MMTVSLPRVVTLQEVCRTFHVSRQTVSAWVRAGTLPPPSRLGRRVYWRPEQIEAALRQGVGRKIAQ
jgi:predicted DNA-binding transcriptional regulator AlpA